MSQKTFYSKEPKSCQRKKYTYTGRNLLSQKEIYCCRKKFTVTENILTRNIGINYVELGSISIEI